MKMIEWKCSICGFRVWRYECKREAHLPAAEFRHAIIKSDRNDAICVREYLVRTGRERDGYVDQVIPGDKYSILFPRFEERVAISVAAKVGEVAK